MTAVTAEIPVGRTRDRTSHAVRVLQVYSVALMVFPSNYDLKVIGAGGYVAALVSYVALALWVASVLLGAHDAFACRYPVRVTLAAMWVVSIASYSFMHRGAMTGEQLSSANRWLIQLAGMSGIVLMAAEGLQTLEDVRRVLRALTWAGSFCSIVAFLQFAAKIDVNSYLKLPGFSQNVAASGNAEIIQRGSLNRVFGTAIDPIELGVAAGMLLTLSLYLLMYDTSRARWKRVVPVLCISLSVAVSVSRSGVIAAVASVGVLVVCLPATRRVKAITLLPLIVGAVYVAAPSLLSTLASYFLAGTSDPSIAHRTDNYPYVGHLVSQAFWLGPGPDTVISDEIHVLDNQYLSTAISMGVLGTAALVFYLAWPCVVALAARHRTADPELRDLCAAVAGSCLAAVLCAATFDGFSFPMFSNLTALTAGLAGAAWVLVSKKMAHKWKK